MNPFLSFLIQSAVAFPSAVTIWLVSIFAINNPFWLSSGLALAGGGLVFWLVSLYTGSRFLKKNGLTRKEYRYIKKNLDEAKKKISRLHKSLFSIRHLPSLKERMELLRMIRKIFTMTKKEPKRFYRAERFYFSHLDSVLELTERYAFLSSQPKRNRELEWSLAETRSTLSEMTKLVEKDLYHVLEDDIDDLKFEIDVAKYSIKNVRDSGQLEESVTRASISKENPVPETKPLDKNKESTNQAETGPRYFINTKVAEKEEVKIPTSREARYKDKNRRFKE
ncbi:5-bromo-4-chloroindolyl phosphate hydrolysis family protein [Mesobacillus maritimus]|uniref:5-bromo-4-chloroindolyl phosphate hydrolysis family protein n=1 Tax=Mesobacillus maritimus TaxID=1643336 RepID=UPI0032E7F8C2